MRYSSALVLGTVAVGQAAALNVRHAGFHARRQADQKRSYDDVDWSKVSYDLSNVDWSSVFASSQATATPTPSSSEVKAEAVSTSPAYTPPPTTTTEAAKSTETQSSNSHQEAGNDLLKGVESLLSNMGVAKPASDPPKSNNGKMWVGGDSSWKTTFINGAASDVVLLCWAAEGYTGMTLNVHPPALAININKGAQETISFAGGVPGACCPAYSDTRLAMFGGCDNTWYEYTFGNNGAFDITRNVNMNGNSISAKGSKCISDMSTCVFKCTGGVSSCEKGYELDNCSASNGGGGGYDSNMQGVGGGCAMGSSEEHVKVTFT
ncbi:uncharacterized protein BDR25DRAFT_258765 [Lindgomyces ingoldianus]|uniref:Uncharacterized protein n=1 Tax=Lindgomyces ingoldianus TaxID=673940 RepID=A0ACB6QZK7_9PLEO|nr:uncharacterized protein BDR25DRAFT_258765 [Lindgomyces ingoldianus]KAF2472423.1 hypothetical protein BDR25DRAFT_258765 [Lindgomyces ingoldianus]